MKTVDIRRMQVRAKAKEFAAKVKESRLAWRFSEELCDWLRDDEIQIFESYLRQFGLENRGNGWEPKY